MDLLCYGLKRKVKEKKKKRKVKSTMALFFFFTHIFSFHFFFYIYIAIELNCYIAVGYPEKHQTKDHQVKYYNSMCFVNRQGELIKTYRKTFLYETDENWAEEGESFDTMMIPEFGKIGFAICMDINPYQFKTDFKEFEFANYHKNEKTDIILGSMAWLKSKQEEDGDDDGNSVMSTINYWALRLSPLIKESVSTGRNILFVACNRIGTERGSTFAGGSSVLEFSSSGEIHLLNHLSSKEENILIVDI
ncbi:unnamed protein product [Cunninghamella echinulata]